MHDHTVCRTCQNIPLRSNHKINIKYIYIFPINYLCEIVKNICFISMETYRNEIHIIC